MKPVAGIIWCAFTLVSPMTAPSAVATDAAVVVVDDDGQQCPIAEHASIAAAVEQSVAGAVIHVCPGLYVEQVTVDKSLTIRGDAATIAAPDCFIREPTDPAMQAIVRAPVGLATDAQAVLFDLRADNVELAGLVLQGTATRPSVGVATSAQHSGYDIHHNLILDHHVPGKISTGANFRSSGDIASSFHHNCLRDDGWGVANEHQPLINARVHDNSTFGIRNFAYELVPACAEVVNNACALPMIGARDVVFEHNVSRADNEAFLLAWTKDTAVVANTVGSARVGIRLGGGNDDLDLVDNALDVRVAGIPSRDLPHSNRNVLIERNSIAGTATAAGIGMGLAALKASMILDNTILGIDGQGIALNPGNTDNIIRGNTVASSGRNGIWTADGARDNTIESNLLHDNGRLPPTPTVARGVDARDDGFESNGNTWRGNDCNTDFPAGVICPVQ